MLAGREIFVDLARERVYTNTPGSQGKRDFGTPAGYIYFFFAGILWCKFCPLSLSPPKNWGLLYYLFLLFFISFNGWTGQQQQRRPNTENSSKLSLCGSMDLLKLHSHNLQQIHSWQEAVRLAIPDNPNHDSHGLLLEHRVRTCPRIQTRGHHIHDQRHLPLFGGSHWCLVRLKSLVIEFGLHIFVCFIHTNAQSPDARGSLLDRGFLEERDIQIKHYAQYGGYLDRCGRGRLRRSHVQWMGCYSSTRGCRVRSHTARVDSNPSHLQRYNLKPYYFSLLCGPVLLGFLIDPMGTGRVSCARRHVIIQVRLFHLRDQFGMRLCAKSGGLSACGEDISLNYECGGGCEGLASHRFLLVGDQGSSHGP